MKLVQINSNSSSATCIVLISCLPSPIYSPNPDNASLTLCGQTVPKSGSINAAESLTADTILYHPHLSSGTSRTYVHIEYILPVPFFSVPRYSRRGSPAPDTRVVVTSISAGACIVPLNIPRTIHSSTTRHRRVRKEGKMVKARTRTLDET